MLHQMKTFCAVVQEKGFRRAAEKLYISQASVSQHVYWLEKRFGVQLFQRKGRGVVLTPDGKAFYSLTRDILRKVEDLPRSLQSCQELAAGSLELALTLQVLSPVIARVLSVFRDEYPNVALTLRQIREREVNTVIEEGNAEIVLTGRNSGESLAPHLTGLNVAQTPLVLVGSPAKFDPGESPKLGTERLNALDFIVFPEGTALRTLFDDFVLDNQLRPKTCVSLEDPSLAIQLAEAGAGVVLIGEYSVKEALAKGSLIALEPENSFSLLWEIQAVYHTYRGLSFAGWAFLRTLREGMGGGLPPQ